MSLMDTIREKKITRISDPVLKPLTKKRVAAYCRVSVDYEINIHSLNAQVDYYTKMIGANPAWEFAGVYADSGLSGTTSNRAGFEALIKDCEQDKIDIIFTKSISRFARNTVLLLETVRHLKEKGINVHFERENIDSISGDGELLLTLLASFAQAESESISQNTRWAFRRNFEKGIGCHTNPMLGYRFNGDGFDIVEDEARVVQLIFELYLNGMSPDGITTYLNSHGYTTLKGKPFKYGCVWDILRQEKYTGNSIFQKTYSGNSLCHKTLRNHGQLPKYYAEGTHPVIIPQETFEAVQAEIKRRKALGYLANTTKNFSAFTGKIICAKCGKTYRRSNSGTSGRHKTKYYYWKCGTRFSKGKAGCDSPLLPESTLLSLASEVTDSLENIGFVKVDGNKLVFSLLNGHIYEKEMKNEAS